MTEIRLHDTMAREKRVFTPADPERVTMYVCGPTVYNRAHIGNARPAVVFDVLARLLRHVYGAESLVYARNVTDVDDKIIATAEAEGVAAKMIATVEELDAIALDDHAKVAALTGWRREIFGEKALELKHGRLALTVEHGKVVTLEWREAADEAAE